MDIKAVYKQFRIPKHLQRHMLLVAQVGATICDACEDQIDKVSVETALKLHDLGNLLKFELEKSMEMFETDERNLKYWLKVREEIREDFGADVHGATMKMVDELGVSERVKYLIANMSSKQIDEILEGVDWERKVCAYADFRVIPLGIVGLEERLQDLQKRYTQRSKDWSDQKWVDLIKVSFRKLERQIQRKVRLDLNSF